jgi:hypothetical protein
MARRTVTAASSSIVRRPESAIWAALGVINQLSSLTSRLMTLVAGDGLLASSTTPGFSIDGSPEDVETDSTIVFRHQGQVYSASAVAALDISAAATCAADVITDHYYGAFWAFMSTAGGLDLEDAAGTPQAHASAVIALSQWAVATNPLPPTAGAHAVCIGALTVAPTAADHTMGTTTLATVGTFYDLIRRPSVEVAAASFALVAASATYVYGATTFVLGSGTRVAASGKTGCALTGTSVANGAVGVWLVYGLADDVEYALQLGYAYATVQAAKDAIRDSSPNPLLALIGTIIIDNKSGAAYVPASTLLDKSGLSVTFTKNGPGADAIEVGRAALNQPFLAADDIVLRQLGTPS